MYSKLLFGPVLDPEHERGQKDQYDPKTPIQKTVFAGKRDGKRHEKTTSDLSWQRYFVIMIKNESKKMFRFNYRAKLSNIIVAADT